MDFTLARIQPRRRAKSPADDLLEMYRKRTARYSRCEVRDFASEEALGEFLAKTRRRSAAALFAADPRGEQLTSEQIAARLRAAADAGTQEAVLAIGPPDGWSAGFLEHATVRLAFGRITLPHELAAVVLAEQLYRAQTIIAGHPYHSGH